MVQWYNRGKIVPIFYKQTAVGDRLTAGVKFCTHAQGKINQKLPFQYVCKSSGKSVTVSRL